MIHPKASYSCLGRGCTNTLVGLGTQASPKMPRPKVLFVGKGHVASRNESGRTAKMELLRKATQRIKVVNKHFENIIEKCFKDQDKHLDDLQKEIESKNKSRWTLASNSTATSRPEGRRISRQEETQAQEGHRSRREIGKYLVPMCRISFGDSAEPSATGKASVTLSSTKALERQSRISHPLRCTC